MADLIETQQPLVLFVPQVHWDMGEGWIRSAYRIGPDVQIKLSQPLPTGGRET